MAWEALALSAGLGAVGGIGAKSAQTQARRAHRRRTRAQIGYSECEQAPLFAQREELAGELRGQVIQVFIQHVGIPTAVVKAKSGNC